MHAVSLTMVSNEADILELFVRHHLRFIDHMVLILHGDSIDGTEEIALALQVEGLPLTLEYNATPAYEQSSILTEAAQKIISAQKPDLLLPLDCDEFLCAPPGISVRHMLEQLPTDTLTAVPWRTYIPMQHTGPLISRMTHRRQTEAPQYSKIIIPSRFLTPDLLITQGAHGIQNGETWIYPDLSETLWMAHLPIRSAEQARKKALTAWPRQRDNPNRESTDCYQWQLLYEEAEKYPVFSPKQVTALAATYACTKARPRLTKDPLAAYVSATERL